MNQHYVPRVYLKNFATQVGKEFFINVFDKIENRYFKANIKKICSETDFYTLPKGSIASEDILAIEKIYSTAIEPMYNRAYKILTCNDIFNINDVQRVDILIGVLHLYMRNPRILKKTLSYHAQEISKLCTHAKINKIKGITYLKEDFSFREWQEDSIIKFFSDKIIKDFKEKHIGATSDVLRHQNNIKIEINIARANANLITGDNPLAVEDFFTKEELPFEKSSEFILPLNKKFMLKLYHDNRKDSNFIYRASIPNGNVNFANEAVFTQSTRFLFGDKSDFDEYFRLQNFLTKDSLEMRVDMAKQILEIIPESEENKEAHNILRNYYEKHQQDGFVTREYEQEMMRTIRQLAVIFKGKIIT